MNEEKDYASDTDESDDDFRPEDLLNDSPASEDDAEDSESNGELDEDNEVLNKRSLKRKGLSNTVCRKKTKSNYEELDDENTNTSRRSTRQKDNQTNGKGKQLEKDELLSDDEDKSRTNALWADFLKDVNPTETSSRANTSQVDNKPSSSGLSSIEGNGNIRDEAKLKLNLTPKVENKIVVKEVLDFAGEAVSIQREIDGSSSVKENKAATIVAAKKQPFSRIMPGAGMKRLPPTAAGGSAPGVGSILNQLGKKKKFSVLEKSQMDWKSFKQSEGIDEQLQTFNKGKNGYLERQDFLQRTDLRQFEIEKKLRQTSRRPY